MENELVIQNENNLEQKQNQLLNEQKNLQEQLNNATKMIEEGTTTLEKPMNEREFHQIGVPELLGTADNAKLPSLKNQFIQNSDTLNQLRK
jgi:hypothetical protein